MSNLYNDKWMEAVEEWIAESIGIDPAKASILDDKDGFYVGWWKDEVTWAKQYLPANMQPE